MSWSQSMRKARRARGGQADMFDAPILAYKLVFDGNDPLTNLMVRARGAHDCFICAGPIEKGERIRAESRRSEDGKRIETRRVCPTCCTCIRALHERGDMEAIAERFMLGGERRRA